MSLKAYITNEASIKLNYYYHECVIKHLYLGRTEEEQALVQYCESDEYNLHLTYLIETWVSNMESQFYISMKDGLEMDWYFNLNDNEFNFVEVFTNETTNKFIQWKNNYDGTFDYINKCYEDGCCFPEFNDEWIYDIFERKILDVVLK
jgi:hypothetical protein